MKTLDEIGKYEATSMDGRDGMRIAKFYTLPMLRLQGLQSKRNTRKPIKLLNSHEKM